MKIIFYIPILLFWLTSCSTIDEKKSKSADPISIKPTIDANPKVEVKISLKDTILKSNDKILLKITLTNNGSINQRLLFDKPLTSTGGPWGTSATVIDVKTSKSVLKYKNKAILSSQIYSEDQLTDKYYNLTPKQSINREYELTDIVVFKSEDYLLPKGKYIIQLFYYNNISNVVTLLIK